MSSLHATEKKVVFHFYVWIADFIMPMKSTEFETRPFWHIPGILNAIQKTHTEYQDTEFIK